MIEVQTREASPVQLEFALAEIEGVQVQVRARQQFKIVTAGGACYSPLSDTAVLVRLKMTARIEDTYDFEHGNWAAKHPLVRPRKSAWVVEKDWALAILRAYVLGKAERIRVPSDL